jgi:hypothetical protein
MAIAMTLDQRASRGSSDHVKRVAGVLNRTLKSELELPFVRTAGDEMQALLASGSGLVRATTFCLEDRQWWIGIGLGGVERPLGLTAREARGPAFWCAREAIELAHNQKSGPPGGVAVVGEPSKTADDLQAALSAIAYIVERRTPRQEAAVRRARVERGLRSIAESLEITVQTASKLLRSSGYAEQLLLERMATRIADKVA